MSFAFEESEVLSVDEFIVNELTPEAVSATGSMIAKRSIQTPIIENLRLVIKRPSFPNVLSLSCAMCVVLPKIQ
jgi:hypothetical protein